MVPTQTALPLFPGVPGGPELVIVLMIFVLILLLPALLIVGGLKFLGSGDDDRVEELERRVEELERERGDE